MSSLNLDTLLNDLNKSVKPISLESRYFSDRAKEFNPDEHEIVGETQSHNHYNCPFCLEERGKEDDDGKFYWNYEKLVGMCFKCNTIGFLKSDKPTEQVKMDVMLNQLISNMEKFKFDFIRDILHESTVFNIDDFSQILSEKSRDYLDQRIPFYSEICDALNFREVSETGILIPYYYKGDCKLYNIRLFRPSGKMKYYIAKNVEKIPYSPTRLFDKTGRVEEITLVEGAFDAIAAYLDGYQNPIALNGLTITPMMAYILRGVVPDSILIYLDDVEKGNKLKNQVRKIFPTVSKIRVRNTWGEDPEETFKYKLSRNPSTEYLQGVLSRINEIKEMA